MQKRKFDTNEFGPQKNLLQILTYGNHESTVGLDTFIKAGVDAAIGMIDIVQNGPFYDLTISAPEPIFARDFSVTLIEELDAHQRKYNKAKTSETKQFIEERIIDAEKELNIAEEALRDFTYFNDIISGTRGAIDKNYECDVFNLGNYKSEQLMDVISLNEGSLGKKAEINFLPIQPDDIPESFADIYKSIDMLDYKPTTNVDIGIEELITWYKEFYKC